MKRNLDLIRDILLKIESFEPRERITIDSFVTEEFAPDVISLHIELLLDCDYIEATRIDFCGVPYSNFIIDRITSDGYDYLDSVRDNTVWNKTKEKLTKVGGSAALDVVKEIGKAITLTMIGI